MDTTSARSGRRVALVVGAGRSGTSTMSGLLRILGMHVPQPEILADETNPRGFGEPAWVVEAHDSLLARANVQVVDARPGAWDLARKEAANSADRSRFATWLEEHLAEHPALVVKDPRLVWFLPTWRAAAQSTRASLGFVTLLRSPAEVIGSRQTYYEPGRSPAHLAAGWVNALLRTELDTRGAPGGRVFVRYADLLADWRATISRVDGALDLSLDFTDEKAAAAAEFVDPSLRRVTPELRDLELPPRLHELVGECWTALNQFADPGNDGPESHAHLDELRTSYAELYREAEDMSTSSIIAARRSGRRQERARQRQAHRGDVAGLKAHPPPGKGLQRIQHRVRAAVAPRLPRRFRQVLRPRRS